MRALCGAIITAGALVALGLTALGYGIRYQGAGLEVNPNTHQIYAAPTLALILVITIIAVFIGVAMAFLGLAFHHERRHRERLGKLSHEERAVTPP